MPMVDRSEAEIGIANIFEVAEVRRCTKVGKSPNLRLIGVAAQLPRRILGAQGFADEDHRRSQGQARSHGLFGDATIDKLSRGDPGDRRPDRKGRHADSGARTSCAAQTTFASGAADMFSFAFGAPKVREVDATVGGIRALEIPESGMAAARKIFPDGYLRQAAPGRSSSASTSRWTSTPGTI